MELLYVGGFLSRAAYELELSDIHTAWASAADGTPDSRPPPELQDRLQDRFLHTLKFFAFHHTTPSSKVGRLLEDSFYGSSTVPLRMLSSVGVREASDIKEHDPIFTEFLKDVPMLPQSVIHECGRTIKTLQNQGMISPVTVSDVLHDLRQRQLNKEELVSCLRWWIGLKQDSSAINLAQLLEVSVFSNADGSILPLSSVRYFVDPQTLGGRIPQDSPLANSLLPQDIAKQFTPAELSSFGWQEFTVDDDDALLEARISMVAARRRFIDDSNRSSCPRAHPPHYSTTMRYVAIRSVLPHVNNTLEPPSPASRKKSLQSGAPPPGSSSPGPPIIPSVEMPDPKPTSDDPASSEGNRRIIREWFRKVMTKRSHNRTPRRTPSDASPQPGIPSKTKAAPQNEKPSTMSPGKRSAVSVPFSVEEGTDI
jgi:hypothetical protein